MPAVAIVVGVVVRLQRGELRGQGFVLCDAFAEGEGTAEEKRKALPVFQLRLGRNPASVGVAAVGSLIDYRISPPQGLCGYLVWLRAIAQHGIMPAQLVERDFQGGR